MSLSSVMLVRNAAEDGTTTQTECVQSSKLAVILSRAITGGQAVMDDIEETCLSELGVYYIRHSIVYW